MYPYPETARQRIAELHHQAERDTVAIAIRWARRARTDRSGPAMPARLARAARRALVLVLPRLDAGQRRAGTEDRPPLPARQY
jgi:hypothetical protein